MANELSEQQMKEIKDAFALFDKDNDGSISLEELETAMKAMGQTPTKAELAEMIKEADSDGNGKVDFNEFVTLISKSLKEDYVNEELLAAFKVYDQDGDGFISREEIRNVLIKLGDKEPDEKVINSILREGDQDGDGVISLDEFAVMLAPRAPKT